MQILDIILVPRYMEDPPKFPFEHTPEYKEMVRRATDSLQHVQDSLRRAAVDSASAAHDTLHHASTTLTDSLSTMTASFGSFSGGDEAMTTIVSIVTALCALGACAFAIVKHRSKGAML